MHKALALALLASAQRTAALKLVFAGGTGGLGSALAERCAEQGHSVDHPVRRAYRRCRRRVSEDFGWVGERRVQEWDAQGFDKKIV